ncbi:TPA: UPF0489 family protein [Burkholderia cenocepacia]|uniref:UPF0489 family protein n=1 Tax=Burkholderia TaxID=32008 RepID=UPI00158D22F2|nr:MULTISPECIES: UPF0489 family protein [Burkholderia]MBR8198387.1 UPF0489 family protein [Burkholderia cenocepacia]HDV6325032.1 UPF0489 family protein [Burkholderia cenocepacia]HDV6353101.1 UPF0489 family protein [Burkholderia cenocepacia]
MDESEIAQLQPDDEYLVALSEDVWLMDDHRWALLVWEQFAQARGIRPFSLVHADYHWDAINDFHQNVEQRDALLAAEPLELCALIREGNWIRYDSFIAPAVIRGLVNDVHFFCMQDDDEPGLDSELLSSTGARQTLYGDAVALSQTNFDAPLIFDLCLDLFNRSDEFYTSDLWSDAEIVTFLEHVRPFIEQAMVVTVSLSFGYSGSEADTRRLAALVLPHLEQWRSARQA